MSTINVQCTDQLLAVSNAPVITSGGVNADYVQFSFCSLWDGFTKTAVFYMSEDEVYQSALDAQDKCVIPSGTLQKEGTLYFGVFGVSGNVTRTSQVLTYSIEKGAFSPGTTPDPSPSIYQQILAGLAGKVNEPATEGTAGQVLTTDGAGGRSWTTPGGGGGGGTVDQTYNPLSQNAQSGIAVAQAVQDKYEKPNTGIPESDLSQAVQTKLNSGGGITEVVLYDGTTKLAPSTQFVLTQSAETFDLFVVLVHSASASDLPSARILCTNAYKDFDGKGYGPPAGYVLINGGHFLYAQQNNVNIITLSIVANGTSANLSNCQSNILNGGGYSNMVVGKILGYKFS